jgi:Nucleotidyltransferase of unknown function (DUF6036)
MAAEDLIAFLEAVDAELAHHTTPGETLDLHLFGRSALILAYGVRLMTKDVDVVEVGESPLLETAARVFRRGGPEHERRGFYLEFLSPGFPPVSPGFPERSVDLPGAWRVLRPRLPEIHDLIVSKLKRFHAGDREDVRILCDTGEVDEAILRGRFDSAYLWADQDDLKYLGARAHLEAVAGYLDGRSLL